MSTSTPHRRALRSRWTASTIALATAATAGLAALTSCTGGDAAPAPEARVVEVAMRDDGGDFRFEPARVEVRRGDIVRFVQEGTMPHNVQFVRNEMPDGVELDDAWSGPFLNAPGDTYDVVVDERFVDGSYGYVCAPHIPNGMKGTIVVDGSAETGGANGDGSAETPPANGGSASAADEPVPAITGEHGLQPLPYEMDGDTKVFQLTAERVRWETKEGELVDAMAYNRMVPGPLIRVTEGDRVRLVVTNELDEPHTTHWHGLFVPNAMDGVPGITQDPIMPGESFTYEFTAAPHGTRLYHSHFNTLKQEGRGLYGMFVIEEKDPPAERRADREELMLLGDGPLGFLINGKEFPMTEPIRMRMGERVRVRIANLGGMYHPMHMHGGFMTLVAKDGFPLPEPQDINTLSVAPGETWDVILHPRFSGTWLWHCHVLSHVTGPTDADGNQTSAGMITAIVVEDGDGPVPDLDRHTNH